MARKARDPRIQAMLARKTVEKYNHNAICTVRGNHGSETSTRERARRNAGTFDPDIDRKVIENALDGKGASVDNESLLARLYREVPDMSTKLAAQR